MTHSNRVSEKKIYDTGVAHPAVYSESVLEAAIALLDESHRVVLDPFAGVGRIHELQSHLPWNIDTIGVELEPEWASLHPHTIVGDALALDIADGSIDAVMTSPTYGNRLADHHKARDGSIRRSYTHDIGRDLSEGNSGVLHWGTEYRVFHERAWREVKRVLRPEGRFVLNISDHIRSGERQHVTSWHTGCILGLGFVLVDARHVATPRLRQGANRNARIAGELMLAFDLPSYKVTAGRQPVLT